MQSRMLVPIALATAFGCSPGSFNQTATLVTETEIAHLTHSEPGAKPTEYRAVMATLRLFGVQPGDDAVGPTATLADTSTWETRTYQVGDALSRNLVLDVIGDDFVVLAAADGARQTVTLGEDVELRQVLHRFDDAAVEQGRHLWIASAAMLEEVAQRHGLGIETASNEILTPDGLEVINLDPDGLFARVGLRAGDLILSWEGESALAQLSNLASAVNARGENSVRLRIFRGIAAWDLRIYLQ